MSKLTLGLAMIVKDETNILDNCLESISGIFDKIVIGYTSKNHPETERIFAKHKATIIPIEWKNDFAYARNITFKECGTDLIMWLDADDTLTLLNNCTKEQFKERVIKTFEDNVSLGAMFAFYRYDHDKNGKCISTLERERVMRKGWFNWVGKLHENCIPLFNTLNIRQDYFEIKHHSTPIRMGESARRNFEIAIATYQEELKEKKVSFLTVYDLARSISVLNMVKIGDKATMGIEACIPYFHEALELAKNDSHRAEIFMKLAEICRKTKRFNDALEIDSKVIKMKPTWPDGFIGLGNSYFLMDKYKDALACYINSLNLDIPDELLATDPTKYKVRVWEKISWCLFYLEQPQSSLKYINMVLIDNPDHTDMLSLKTIIEDVLKKQKMTLNILEIKEELDKEKNIDKIKSLALSLPEFMDKEAFAIRLKNEYAPTNKKNRVIIYCGESKATWSPNSITSGIGGSEEAVIYISRELAELGWNVDVYCNCDNEGNFNGVMWKSYLSYTDNEKADIFIAWRNQHYVSYAPKDTKVYVWLHDVTTDDRWNPILNDRINKVFFLSEYHRSLMKLLPEDKVFLTSNGIIKEQFSTFDEIEKIKNRCVYVSNPDRGLEHLLNIWPEIKKAIPDATLGIYYGFEVWDMTHEGNEIMRKKKEWMIETMSKYRELGVSYFGKVGHMELAEAMNRAEYWLYPDYEFPEIFCISAIKAQASGCLPIHSGLAALKETAKYGIYISDKDKYLAGVIGAIKDGVKEKWIDDMKKWARGNFQWKTIAKSWDSLWKQ